MNCLLLFYISSFIQFNSLALLVVALLWSSFKVMVENVDSIKQLNTTTCNISAKSATTINYKYPKPISHTVIVLAINQIKFALI